MNDIRKGIADAWAYLVAIIFWPATVALLFKIYFNIGLDFRAQAAIETLKVQNRDRGCWIRLRAEMTTFCAVVLLGILIDWASITTVGVVFLVISFTELLLRKAVSTVGEY